MRRALALSAAITGMFSLSILAEPSLSELQQELDQLKAQVGERQSGASVDRVVMDVLADANQRSAIFAADTGMTAGYDKGFFIKSEDGKFLLRPNLWWQFRHITNFRDEEDDIQEGFENRRVWLRFDGNVFTPDLTYLFVWETSRTNGSLSLLDAYGQYRFGDTWALKFGQFREAFSQERTTSCYQTMAVDRSLVDTLMGGNLIDRVQGVSLAYGSKEIPLRAEFTFSDGANTKNTDFQNPPVNATDWGVAGRVEYKFSGDWANFKDFTAKGTKTDLFVLGAGVDATERNGSQTYMTTVDAQYENPNGLGLFGALHGNFTDLRNTVGDSSRFDWGAVGQVGYAFGGNWEVFGRISYICFDEDFVDNNSISEYEVGVTYFFGANGAYMHRAKVTVDIGYLPDGSPSDQTGIGILASADDEIVIRGQFQLQL
jgi:hypothetical protein